LDYGDDPGRFSAAREQLNRASSFAPDDPCVLMTVARLELMQENYPEALVPLQRVFEADPLLGQKQASELLVGFTPEALQTLVRGLCKDGTASPNPAACAAQSSAVAALLFTAYDELGEANNAVESKRALERLAKTTKAAAVHLASASYSARFKQLDLARHSRTLSTQEKTDLGVLAFHLGKYDQALQVLNQVYDDRALYFFSQTSRALAREAFLEAIRRNPDSYRSHLLLADLANDRHDAAQALAEYEKAAEIGADNPEVELSFVQFLTSQGRDSAALARAEVALQRFPTHAGLNSEIGSLLLKAKRTEEAEPYFERALAADPDLTMARAGLADVHAAQGDLKRAIPEMDAALHGDPDGSYHYRLGRWLQKTGQVREADEAFRASTKLKEEKLKRDVERFSSLRPAN
jgi:Tfp pilus assembly protein PilF